METIGEEMSEPNDMLLEEQLECEPPAEMNSQTEDFETKAFVAGSSRIMLSSADNRRRKD